MVKPKVTITEKGKADWEKYAKAFKNMNKAYVTVGIHEGAGQYQGNNAPMVFEVALWNEFGTERIPSRPFMGLAIDGGIGKINAWREEAIDKILNEGWSVQKGLEMLGFRIPCFAKLHLLFETGTLIDRVVQFGKSFAELRAAGDNLKPLDDVRIFGAALGEHVWSPARR